MRPLWMLVLSACGRLSFDSHGDAAADTNHACAAAVDVAAGRSHSCLVTPAGAVWCWGRNQLGQVDPARVSEHELVPVQPVLPRPATAIGAGKSSTCALLDDQSVWCWGANNVGQLGAADVSGGPVAVPELAAVEISVGAETACARRASDSGIVCWGDGRFGENGGVVPTFAPRLIANTIGAQQVRIGHRHGCFVDVNGAAQCWGRNSERQLGDLLTTNRSTPTAVMNGGWVVMTAAGSQSSCVVGEDGGVRCWGANNRGQLGDGTIAASGAPVAADVANVADVVLSVGGACARQRYGALSCWGSADAGNGTGERGPKVRPSLATNVTRVSSAFFHSCAVANGEAVCWGGNNNAELGRGARSLSKVPVSVDLQGRIPTQLEIGSSHACTADGATVSCWGTNDDGWIGDGTTNVRVRPADVVPGIGTIAGLEVSEGNTCVWNANAAACWGRNDYGQSGSGTASQSSLQPVLVQGLGTPIEILEVGRSHACASVGGAVSCWGRNVAGQLGNGSTNNSLTPVSTGLVGVTQMAAGLHHTCAVTSANVLFCWGEGALGKLGTGSVADAPSPVTINVMGNLPIKQAATGKQHTCAVTTAGAAYCWGSNFAGQLGLGHTTDQSAPKLVIATNVIMVTAGGDTTCARITDGSVECWGASYFGQVPSGSLSNALSPTPIPALAGVDHVRVDELGGCARTGSNVACWGLNQFLASGDVSDYTPVPPNVPCP